MSNTIRLSIPTGSALLAAPRQVWLAALGAAAVTREWAEKEAGSVFRALVKEGSVVESRTIRVATDRIQTSIDGATKLARSAQSGVKASIETLAAGARSLVRSKLPAVHARIDVETSSARRKPAAKTAAKRRATSARRSTKARTK